MNKIEFNNIKTIEFLKTVKFGESGYMLGSKLSTPFTEDAEDIIAEIKFSEGLPLEKKYKATIRIVEWLEKPPEKKAVMGDIGDDWIRLPKSPTATNVDFMAFAIANAEHFAAMDDERKLKAMDKWERFYPNEKIPFE